MAFHLYVSLQNDDCIRHFLMDPQTGALKDRGRYEAAGGPAPMALDAARHVVHVGYRGLSPEGTTGNDGTPRPEYGLGSFAIDPRSGALRPIARIHTGAEPSYVRTDRQGRFLLSTYFQAGHCAVHRLDADGGVTEPPVEWRATNSGAHSIHVDSSNRFVFVPHIAKGNSGLPRLPPERQHPANAIFQFRFDAETGRLSTNEPPRCGPPADQHLGPRHACFHPTQPWFYTVNEQGSSVTKYTLDRERGTLAFGETVSTLPPEGFPEKNSTAEIQIHRSGRFLYASNRGHDSIATYTVDESTGRLTPTGWAPAEPRPRAFMLDPTGRFLYSAGFDTGRLTAYRIEAQTGTLTELERYEAGRVPMWVLIVELPET